MIVGIVIGSVLAGIAIGVCVGYIAGLAHAVSRQGVHHSVMPELGEATRPLYAAAVRSRTRYGWDDEA